LGKLTQTLSRMVSGHPSPRFFPVDAVASRSRLIQNEVDTRASYCRRRRCSCLDRGRSSNNLKCVVSNRIDDCSSKTKYRLYRTHRLTESDFLETTKTAHEPKRPRPKRPINFRYDQNGPQLHPKRPTPKSKTAHDSAAAEALKKWDGGRSSRWMSLWKGFNPSPVLGVRMCYPREIFDKRCKSVQFGTF